MNNLYAKRLLLCFSLFITVNTLTIAGTPAKEIDKIMNVLHKRGQYNGSILVAVNGAVIYKNGFGDSDLKTHQPFVPATISCIASVSKQFTSMAIMMLAERKKLKYDDPVTNYIAELPSSLSNITIRHLLTHTSGIPDVGDLGIDHPLLTNQEVISTLIKRKDLVYQPGLQYQYSNTGYILLSVLIERISGQAFTSYLKESIFMPLGMYDTIFFTDAGDRLKEVASGYSQYGGLSNFSSLTTGDGGMFSNVTDLYTWDQTLYTEKLVKQTTLNEAFIPGSVSKGVNTYGFGWNITTNDGSKLIWHTGNTGGYRAFICRKPKEKITIIMLTNKGNSRRMEISNAILNILDQKPYVLPKIPISEKLYDILNKQTVQQAVYFYDSLQVAKDITYDLAESELNSLGYQLLSEHKLDKGVRIFELNTTKYPQSSNAFDSLGEAYVAIRNKDMAIKAYEKALSLDPGNLHAKDMLNKLKSLK